MLTIRYTLTQADVGPVYRRLMLRRWSHWTIIAIGVSLIAWGAVFAEPVFLVIGAAYVVGWAAFLLLLVPRIAWRRYLRIGAEQVVTVSEDGVTLNRDHAQASADWTVWRHARLLAGVYVIRARYSGFCLIPRRAFASAQEEQSFRSLVEHGTGSTLR